MELIVKFLPLVETLGRKFSTSDQASGVMTIMDIIQAVLEDILIEAQIDIQQLMTGTILL